MAQLAGKWALVTGSSRGIGQQIAVGLARQGCNVIVHGRDIRHAQNTLALLAAEHVQATAVAGDLGSAEGVQSIIKGVQDEPCSIDILYNNAAIQNPWKPIWDMTIDEWLQSFQINLFATVALCTALAPGMKQHKYGRIINLTSGVKDTPELAPYSASKAALDKYTQDLAAALRGTNVLVNTLDPGWLRTDLGGPKAQHAVETVLPGALVPALLEDDGPSGRLFAAQDFKFLALPRPEG